MAAQQGYSPPKGGVWGPTPVRKRLVVCCDGTWQASNHATHEVPSNIAKMSHAISKTYIDEHNQAAPQIVYYDVGVATADVLDKAFAGKRFYPSLSVSDNLLYYLYMRASSPAINPPIIAAFIYRLLT